MSQEIKQRGNGPFAVGARVHLRALESDGTVVEIGPTETVLVSVGPGEGELHAVTAYTIELDNGLQRQVMDRDDHIVAL